MSNKSRGTTLKSVKSSLRAFCRWFYLKTAKLVRIRNNLIVFDSFAGKGYTGSPKAVYEYFIDHDLQKDYELVWFLIDPVEGKSIPGHPKIVKYRSWKYYYYLSKARFWVFDARNPNFLIKKDCQTYIQIWHGTPLKRLGLDIENVQMAESVNTEQYRQILLDNTRQWDYLVAQNEFSYEVLPRCFGFNKITLKSGYPRNDILFTGNNDENIRSIKRELGIPLDKKVILYAPTFRDDEYDSHRRYIFNPHIDYDLLRNELSDNYVMIVKYHYYIAKLVDLSSYKGFIYQISSNADISLLYLVSDLLITDYSSVMFDYSLLHRPMFFYCYDLEKYAGQLRGFYFDLTEEAPGPISTNTEELIRDIRTPEDQLNEQYMKKREAFYAKYHTYENGTASRQIADLICSIHDKGK